MVVAVDAMGGDNAPFEIVKGAVAAINEMNDIKVILVGKSETFLNQLSEMSYNKEALEIVEASEVIGTDETPANAVRRKKDSSIVKGLNLVKNGEADAFVSAGSTGAILLGATVIIGRLDGVLRPALGTAIPGEHGITLLMDSGANVDCKPIYLEQFAKLASVYVENVMGIKNPKVGLVNIGTEEEKGNMLTKEAYTLLKESNVNFIGNIEPREITSGDVDVAICDGFLGNSMLKLIEGVSKTLLSIIKTEITSGAYKIAAAMLKKPFKKVKMRFDSEEVGGAPFLGLKALVVKAHGNSKEKAIKNAIKQCKVFVKNDIVSKTKEKL
ncbi:MAG: phosphate acyltransferase PlsX [Lachnospiraceae bacterium]|nr:phosphate acyltransferase PlsX [Lachnospiraceae bacterium]